MAKETTYKHIEDASDEEYDNHSKEYCGSCGFKKPSVEEQYSFGVYAGRLCRECAIRGYRDACGLLDGQQGDQNDLDEPLEPEEQNDLGDVGDRDFQEFSED